MTSNPQGTVDPLDFSDVFTRGSEDGLKVTITVPTSPVGIDSDTYALILRAEIKKAHHELVDGGLSDHDAEAILAPASELVNDSSFWRLQSRGLIIFAAEGFHKAVRIPIEVAEDVYVGDQFKVLPLAPVLDANGRAFILALSKNKTRLYEATRNAIVELPLGKIPETFEDVIDEEFQQSLQQRSIGGGDSAFYGTGSAGESESKVNERWLKAVAKLVAEELGTGGQPLVLASVAEYFSAFKDNCPYQDVHENVLAGNPEHTKPEELRSAVWRELEGSERSREAEERDNAMTEVFNGRGSTDPAEIANVAEVGRVDTIYLPRDVTQLKAQEVRVFANRALLATLRDSGTIRALDEFSDDEVFATYRY
ncbi:hypothetical protein [Corynebacterium sputi]|uniref:baeRF3 domain-containing protein n=1 Tax=Corynebacterium sputi TaxID=489915 RepID=UPI0003F5628B|nr:hypothetical protein [Corynebacterium sputi]